MAGFYTALIDPAPTIHWPGLSPPCTVLQSIQIVLASGVCGLGVSESAILETHVDHAYLPEKLTC